MICPGCGTQWDVDDSDKPECKFELQQNLMKVKSDYDYCDRSERLDIKQELTRIKNLLRGMKKNPG